MCILIKAPMLGIAMACSLSITFVSGMALDDTKNISSRATLFLQLEISHVKQDGALCSVSISPNTSQIVESGVLYNTLEIPTIKENKVVSRIHGLLPKIFLTNLDSQTAYGVRAYAIEKNGEIFCSDAVVFTTLEPSEIDLFKATAVVNEYSGYALIWSDEFNVDGRPSPRNWSYEHGYVRNEEAQYYSDSEENSEIKDGLLVITGRKNHNNYPYTSSSLHTKDRHHFTYGRFEIRAKIPTSDGCWPAIWTLGNKYDWPIGGEIDIMEFYDHSILANAAWSASTPWSAVWNSKKVAITKWTNEDIDWPKKFHVWRMDWSYDVINLYLDNELINSVDLNSTFNQGWKGNYDNPFRFNRNDFGQYFILNLALGGTNGRTIDDSAFPIQYKIDYIRVYQTLKD